MTLRILLFFVLSCSSLIKAQQKSEKGKASYYADRFEGKSTASGAIYRHEKMTAAHKTLAFGTKVRVTNLSNNKRVIVTINDRGPFVNGRIIDVSRSAAQKLDFINEGVTDVSIIVLSTNEE